MFESLRRSSLIGLMVLAGAMILSCSEPETPDPATADEPAREASRESSRETGAAVPSLADAEALDRAARFLAGYQPMDVLEPEQWNTHAEEMARLWSELESRRLDNMRHFAEDKLELLEPSAPLIYPFGGPDFLSANRFFPEAAAIVLIGLEPPGEVWIPALGAAGDEFETAADSDLATALERLRGGFRSLLDAGYFVTRRMEEDLAGTHLNGVLPVLLMFLAQSGATVVDAHYVELDEAGTFQDTDPLDGIQPVALRIAFIDSGDAQAGDAESTSDTPRSLYYVSQDLSNEGFDGSNLQRFLEQLDGFNVYMKSAQYLIHQDAFSSLERTLIEGARDILQDDSGIPLCDLDEGWRHRFFGVYTRTLPAYREYFQEDLQRAFAERTNVEPLDFALGYNTEIGGSGLIWAQRIDLPSAP